MKGKTEVIKYSDKFINLVDGSKMRIPIVMKLIKIIRMIYRNRVPFSKRNIMIRDDFTCAYCGIKRDLTIDHIIPVSQKGKTNWENCITACKSCNNKKGKRTPREAKMFPRKKAYCPTIMEFLRIKMKNLGVDNILKELGVI